MIRRLRLTVIGLAMVVASSISVSAQVLKTGTLAAAGDAVTLSLNGVASLTLQTSGTWEGSTVFEASVDGSNWWPVVVINSGNGAPIAGPVAVNGLFVLNNSGYGSVRARAIGVSSGSITVTATRGFLAMDPALVLKTIGPTGAVLPAPVGPVGAGRLLLPPCNALLRINCR